MEDKSGKWGMHGILCKLSSLLIIYVCKYMDNYLNILVCKLELLMLDKIEQGNVSEWQNTPITEYKHIYI